MRGPSTLWALPLLALTASGCAIVSGEHRDMVLTGGFDAGVDAATTDPDAGPDDTFPVVDRCGDDSIEALFASTDGQVAIDTTGLSNRFTSCGSRAADGNEAFIPIEVRGGDRWHFHVIPDPSVADQDRDPFLYLVDSTCRNTSCDDFSDACRGPGDEHFAFVAPADGTWYLGIDDRIAGGGRYLLEAVKLDCGDNDAVHGEACDGTGTCSTDCREIVDEGRPSEQIPNDNEIEGNFIEMPASREITVTGAIGGDLCTYPDVFVFANDTAGSDLTVTVRKTDGTVCDAAINTPYDIVLRNPDGDVVAGPETNAATGCSELRVMDLPAQSFYLYLEHDEPIEDRPVPYRLHVQLSL